jgi:hypothetical protein
VTAQQVDPRPVVPLWIGAPAVAALATVAALVFVEARHRRRENLGGVLRVGG